MYSTRNGWCAEPHIEAQELESGVGEEGIVKAKIIGEIEDEVNGRIEGGVGKRCYEAKRIWSLDR